MLSVRLSEQFEAAPSMTDPRYLELVAHGVQSLRNAQVFSKPYPHLLFDKFWPEDFYRELLAKKPEPANYVQLNRENTRRQFTLFDGSCDAGDDERRALWKLVSDVMASPEIEAALRDMLDEGFQLRAKGSGEEWPVKMYPRPVAYTDYDGYAIKPHPDTRRKVLTMLIYMPEDDSQADLGTSLYKISPLGVFAWKTYGLVEEKTAPFLPNTGLAFVVIHPRYNLLRSSWHGRSAIVAPPEKPRFSLLNAYYAKPVTEAVY
jgi:hypothetical protein